MPDFDKLAANLNDPSSLITQLDGWEEYFKDATEESVRPTAIVFAENESDVIATVHFAGEFGLPIVARGTGTGLSGGCVPTNESIVLSLERMKKLEIDPAHSLANCGPGVITKELLDAAAVHGLTYPPDPASYEECTLGGNVAENAGGLRCKRFGVTRDYIIGLKAVTADGALLKTGCFGSRRGFNYHDLLIGSEGTLAIVTEIAVRLVPMPTVGSTLLATFDEPTDAGRTVAAIIAAGIVPTVMEYIDGDAADCSNKYEKIDGLEKAGAILLVETAGDRDEQQTAAVRKLCEQNHCSYLSWSDDQETAARLWRVRRNLSKAVKAMAAVRYNEDVAVPVSEFMTLVSFVAAMNEDSPLRINAFGHAGDGNLHVSFLSMTGDPDEKKLIHQGVEELFHKTLELGGTLSGEHGIGKHKAPYLHWEFDPPTLATIKRAKKVFDPDNTMNPGKVFTDIRCG
ncbi:MAG: FAD-binding protein [candidate division Zixibacteria bacterium]|nr:FAD-binding protein [candidate division Zixibacteria bacterium]MDH3936267.1 FAD-binding protein [candidate division Zixibacteria bacterium]MDH4034661.1 FAD-binding protein [candidate division Zixibacteria bacterium]